METKIKYYVLTLFPEMIENGMNTSIIGKAMEKGLIDLEAVNIRDYAGNRYGKVDDYPYGGGAGMLMQPGPVYRAYEAVMEKIQSEKGILENAESSSEIQPHQEKSVPEKKPRVVYLTPVGKVFTQDMAKELAKEENLIFLCGHYEGIDERVIERIVTDPVSIGDYVLTGGELPAMVMMDAISRFIPGVLKNEVSAETESFHDSLLEYPQYTRPEIFMDEKVPEVLISGHHGNVDLWRREQSVIRTAKFRPDLLEKAELSEKEKEIAEQILKQNP